MLRFLPPSLTLAVLSFLLAPAVHAQIVQNGDFTAPIVTDASGSATSIPGWKVVSNFAGVNPANNKANPFADNGLPPKNFAGTGPAISGFLLSQGKSTPAQISQTLMGLTVGTHYVLRFSDNASYVGSPQLPTLTVTVGSVQVYSQKLTPVSAYGGTDKPYLPVTIPFVATGSSEELAFASVSPAPATNTIALITAVTVTATETPKK